MTIKRILNITLVYIAWLPCAIAKDIAELFYIPFDTNRFCQTYVNLRITTKNLETALANVENTQPQNNTEEKKKNGPETWYKTTDIGYKIPDANKCDLTEDDDEDEQIYEELAWTR